MTVHLVAMLLAAALPVIAQGGYSVEKEAALGKLLAEEATRRNPLLDSPAVQSYVRALGERIAPYVPGAKFPFTFSVTADDECRIIHEPTALPGGYIFVPAGLFIAAQDEAEFAGMLAHAMQHVAQTPHTRASILLPMGGSVESCLGTPVVPTALVNVQRSAELEADVLAVQTMARAGFDPNALVRYVKRVQVGTTPSAMPDREGRIATMQSVIEKLPPAEFSSAPPAGFATAKEEVRRLIERQPVHSPAPPSLFRNNPK